MNMRAVVVRKFGGQEVLEVVANAVRPTISGNQLRIKVKSAGINPVDVYIRSGTHLFKPALPYIPGKDGSGIVESCGPDVKKFKAGDRVYFCWSLSGSYAEFCTSSEEHTFPLHDSLSFSHGAALGVPYFTAYRALISKAKAKRNQSVLIHGASGGVGLACCHIASHLGLQVLGTAGTAEGMELLKRNGASHVFNHRDENYVEKIKIIMKDGVNIIIEMLANVNMEKDLEMISPDGHILIVGSRDKTEITPRHIMMKEVTISGVHLSKATSNEWQEMGQFIANGQEAGWVLPVIDKEFKLEDVQIAHDEVIKHTSGSKGKIVLKID